MKITIQSAREYLEEHCLKGHVTMDSVDEDDIRRDMIEFTKLHVEAALKAASKVNLKVVENDYGGVREGCKYYTKEVDTESILTAYPLTNIK